MEVYCPYCTVHSVAALDSLVNLSPSWFHWEGWAAEWSRTLSASIFKSIRWPATGSSLCCCIKIRGLWWRKDCPIMYSVCLFVFVDVCVRVVSQGGTVQTWSLKREGETYCVLFLTAGDNKTITLGEITWSDLGRDHMIRPGRRSHDQTWPEFCHCPVLY